MNKRTLMVTVILVASLAAPFAVYAATSKPTPTTMVEKTAASTPGTMQDQTSAPANPQVEYTLAYPGMLPDNPLYFLKRFRDWVMDLLIADPARKIDFYVLQSDKDLAAAVMLEAKAEGNLTATMILEASMYMNKAVVGANALKAQGQQVPVYTMDNLQKSLTKHEEVLTNLTASVTGATQTVISDAVKQVDTWEAEMAKFK